MDLTSKLAGGKERERHNPKEGTYLQKRGGRETDPQQKIYIMQGGERKRPITQNIHNPKEEMYKIDKPQQKI